MITPSDILRGRILVVDDQAANVALLVQMLQGAGYSSIVSTSNARAVCQLHRRDHFDLILLDVQMPGMDGFEVMDSLREIQGESFPAILIITAQPDHKLRALKSGAKDFISKPFSLPEVLARVYNMLEIRLLHQSEIALSHKRLENSQRIAGLGDWEHNFSSQRLVWSDEVYRILGVPRTDPPRKDVLDRLIPADDLTLIQKEKKIAVEESRRAEFEHRIVRADGEVRYLHQITEMSYDELGRPAVESGIVQDITARRLSDHSLRQSEERYRLMFDLNPSPMWVHDRATLKLLAANQATLALYGYALEELLKLTIADLHAVTPEATASHPEPSLPCQCRAHGRCCHRKKNGAVFPVDVSSHAIDFLGQAAWLVMTTDKTESEAAVAALRESEARFRALSDSAPLGIFECDAQGRAIYLNPSLIALSGRSTAENLGRGWEKNIRRDHRAATSARWLQTISEGGTWDQEQCMIRPDGSERWVHTLAAPSRDSTGRVTGFVGTVEDITERRTNVTAIRESEERYRKLMMLSPDAQFVHVDGLITLVNRAFCLLMGADDPAQLLGKLALDIVHAAYHPLVRVRREMHSNDQPVPPSEMKIVRLDGTTVDVEVNATTFDFLGRKEVQVIARDITARCHAARALKESEERFKFVTRAVSDVVWDWDLVSNTVWWNEGYLTTFGFDAAEVESGIESWTSHIHPKERERVAKSIRHAIDSGMESWSEEYRFERKNGTFAYVQDRGYILRDATNKGIRMVGGMRDLTEQKELEAQSFRAQRMESIGTLAGGIAHDLNNVLAPIMMSIELLKTEPGNDPSRNKLLDTVAISCRRGADLVRQVLSFARGRDGERRLVRLRHLIDDLNGMIGETFPRNIRIVTQVPLKLWDVSADATQLHQVLLNLAVNARDAMPNGGTLTIATSNVSSVTHLSARPSEPNEGRRVLLQVTDTGTGIPPEVRDRIFEPFFTTKAIGGGTGLGLATVHSIVKGHGGSLEVESEVGRGTTFKIYLPAEQGQLFAGSVSPFAMEPPRGRNELVLVVDDESAIRHITQQTLEAFGYRVITAKDGAEAVTIYTRKKEEIAVVLTDMMMPVMDGAAMMRALRLINSAVRIVAVSGLKNPGNRVAASGAGVEDFLTKPYTAQTLLQLVREVLDRVDQPSTRIETR